MNEEQNELKPSSGSTHKHYIGLCGKAYQVRVVDGQEEVLCGGEWITYTRFVDNLADANKWDELCELAKSAFILNPKGVERRW